MKELASHCPRLKHTVQILDGFDLRSMTTNVDEDDANVQL